MILLPVVVRNHQSLRSVDMHDPFAIEWKEVATMQVGGIISILGLWICVILLPVDGRKWHPFM